MQKGLIDWIQKPESAPNAAGGFSTLTKVINRFYLLFPGGNRRAATGPPAFLLPLQSSSSSSSSLLEAARKEVNVAAQESVRRFDSVASLLQVELNYVRAD